MWDRGPAEFEAGLADLQGLRRLEAELREVRLPAVAVPFDGERETYEIVGSVEADPLRAGSPWSRRWARL
ncbi:MAG TPA: hypothetical protein VKY90_12435 [Candidatus Dormibacteraeota bacterium]|nr:hypothetical protein [Candidatus Dormibacteraeota bacterium]